MERRKFLEIIPASSIALLFPILNSCQLSSRNTSKTFTYHQLQVIGHNPIELPEKKRVPFNWPAIGIAPGESISFKVNNKLPDSNLWIRVSIAQEIWDKKLLHVKIPVVEKKLGTINIRFSSVLVPYELKISEEK